MTSPVVAARESEADIQWREWQDRGARADKRSAANKVRLIVPIAIGLAIWLLVQLA